MEGESGEEYQEVLAGVGCHQSPVGSFSHNGQDGEAALEAEMVANLTVVTEDSSLGSDATNEIIITAEEGMALSSGPVGGTEVPNGAMSPATSADKSLGQIVFIQQPSRSSQAMLTIQGPTVESRVTSASLTSVTEMANNLTSKSCVAGSDATSTITGGGLVSPATIGGLGRSLVAAGGLSTNSLVSPGTVTTLASNLVATNGLANSGMVSLSSGGVLNGLVSVAGGLGSPSSQTSQAATPGLVKNLTSEHINTLMNNLSNLGGAGRGGAAGLVEQPHPDASNCFVCGRELGGGQGGTGEGFHYQRGQRLLHTGGTVLEVVGRAVGAAVVTGPEGAGQGGGVDVCGGCSDLINDTDAATAHLAALTSRLTALFHNNQRPKLTLQLLPRPAAPPQQPPPPPRPPALNLDDLAATRSRRGRQPRRQQARLKEEAGAGTVVATGAVQVKRKGGRPRKPYGCHICKRKFLTGECVRVHLLREHSTPAPNTPVSAPHLPPSSLTTPHLPAPMVSAPPVKEEKPDDLRPIAPAPVHCPVASGPIKTSPLKVEGGGMGYVRPRPTPVVPRDAASQVLATLRPIQPKPQAVVGTGSDGSMVVLVTPGRPDAAPALLTLTPGYTALAPPRPAPCHQCPKTFTHEKSRRMHTIAAHGLRKRRRGDPDGEGAGQTETDHHCETCAETFTNKRALGDHRRTHHGAKSSGGSTASGTGSDSGRGGAHACEECPLTFGYKYELERHRETHVPYTQTGPHEFLCRMCGLRVASKAALKIHLHRFHRRPAPPRTYLCWQCGCLAATKKAFTDHQRAHGTEPGPRARCQVCNKDMLASSYRVHLARMHGEPRHQCQTCSAKFTIRSDLMRHLNTAHSTLRPYTCPLCAMTFTTSDALRYHRNKTHSTVVHSCEQCGKSYKWKGELRAHVQRVHADRRDRHQCHFCQGSYADRRKLRHHLNLKHPARHQPKAEEKTNGAPSYHPQGTLHPPSTSALSTTAHPPTLTLQAYQQHSPILPAHTDHPPRNQVHAMHPGAHQVHSQDNPGHDIHSSAHLLHPQASSSSALYPQTSTDHSILTQSSTTHGLHPQDTLHAPTSTVHTLHPQGAASHTLHAPNHAQTNAQHVPTSTAHSLHQPTSTIHTLHPPTSNAHTLHPTSTPHTLQPPTSTTHTLHQPISTAQTLHQSTSNAQTLHQSTSNAHTLHMPTHPQTTPTLLPHQDSTGHLASGVYFMPKLGVELHEEQVTTT